VRPDAVPPDWLRGAPGEWVLSILVQPGASRSGPAGEHDGCLRLRIAAPPVDGRANDALRAFLAARLDVPRAGSRRKRVRVAAACDASTLRARLADGPDPGGG
jgi:uncharacterized protein YggU (UPF0235/DUF167 family)